MQIAFILNASSAERAALFFASHPHVASIDEVDAPFNAGKKVDTLWMIISLRHHAPSGVAVVATSNDALMLSFVADIAARPGIWRAVHRVIPLNKGEFQSLDAVLAEHGDALRASTFRVHAFPPVFAAACIERLDAASIRLEPVRAQHSFCALLIARRDARLEPNRPSFDHLVTSAAPVTSPETASSVSASAAAPPAPPVRILFGIVPSSVQLVEGPGPYPVRICRAYGKIEEVFEFHLRDRFQWTNARALDIGAAPGGWSEYLASKCLGGVVAIDPGEMNSQLLAAAPHIRHIRQLAHAATPLLLHEPKFDIMCCDMNQTFGECASACTALAELLRSGGVLVLTFKSQHVGKRATVIETELAAAVQQLEHLFSLIQTHWLWSNSERERTIIAFRR